MRHPKLRVDLSGIRGLKPPYLLICNHMSNMDFQVCAFTLFPRKIHFVAAASFFLMPKLQWALKAVGAISKVQFQPDVGAIKNMIAALRNGGIVALYPEGQVATEGHTTYINPAVGKLVKTFKVPVVLAHVNGTFNVYPKWRQENLTKGPIHYRLSLLFDQEEINTLSAEEITRRLMENMQYHDPVWAKEHGYIYKGKNPAHGLQNVLYQCPKCKGEATMQPQGDRLTCESCGNGVRLDEHRMLQPVDEKSVLFPTIHDWCCWQRENIRLRFEGDPDYAMESPVVFQMAEMGVNGYSVKGKGTLTYRREGIYYEGTCDGERVAYYFPQTALEGLPFMPGDCFEVGYQKEIYCFRPEVLPMVQKWVSTCDVLRDMAIANGER
ncbi:1-acyl-sn-glycerol-3-phosphate acyltransferase [Eubacteriales bacterium OttesenSCG-928-M02]|nr:1-acyl-sn-glycerol-3-phosphate acyltransferase [Eubacteriales bacterium OttesenSCG-928-M02]